MLVVEGKMGGGSHGVNVMGHVEFAMVVCVWGGGGETLLVTMDVGEGWLLLTVMCMHPNQ